LSFTRWKRRFLLPAVLSHDIVNISETEGVQLVKKYAISREFFPWNLFAPPISEKFLAISVPHMKPPKSLWRNKNRLPAERALMKQILWTIQTEEAYWEFVKKGKPK